MQNLTKRNAPKGNNFRDKRFVRVNISEDYTFIVEKCVNYDPRRPARKEIDGQFVEVTNDVESSIVLGKGSYPLPKVVEGELLAYICNVLNINKINDPLISQINGFVNSKLKGFYLSVRDYLADKSKLSVQELVKDTVQSEKKGRDIYVLSNPWKLVR